MRELINRLTGQVRLRAEGAFPERVLNLCSARGLAFWDLCWESPTAVCFCLRRKDWEQLMETEAALGCRFTVLRREGVPFFLGRFRHRQALVLGLAACVTALVLGSFFIWQFEITGNHTVSDERILRALERCGVQRGTFGMALDGADIRNHVLLDLPELGWIQVNVSGCRARVEVRERRPIPPLVDEQTPANVTARRPGLVLQIRAGEGMAAVPPGTVVEQGQLLISGVEDTDTVGARLLAARGSVTARTWYRLQTAVPLEQTVKRYTGRKHTGFALILGTKRVKFFSNSSVEGANCDKINYRVPCSLFGLPLPLTWVRETVSFYEVLPAQRTASQAEAEAEQALKFYLNRLVRPFGTVESTLVSAQQREGALWVTLSAECREEIGVKSPLYTEKIRGAIARKMQE